MRKVYIYGLKCPKQKCIRYIGQSIKPESRLKRHIKETNNKKGRKTKKEAWIQQLINEGFENKIEIVILEECNDDNIDEREIFYIQKYRQNGNLTNMAEGGKSLRLRGENHPNWGKHYSPEMIKKLSDCKKGEKNPMYGKTNTHTEEWSKNISNSLKKSNKLKQSRSSIEFRNKISNIQSNKTLLLNSKTFSIEHTFINCREAADFLKMTYSNIKNARRNKRMIGKSMDQKFYVIYEKDYIEIENINEYFKKQ